MRITAEMKAFLKTLREKKPELAKKLLAEAKKRLGIAE